jgi:hypothetical protein
MALIKKDSFRDLPGDNQKTLNENAMDRVQYSTKKCSVCGDGVFRKKDFIHWKNYSEIIICEDCAPLTLKGMYRDYKEMLPL